jgi:hypothetical protein
MDMGRDDAINYALTPRQIAQGGGQAPFHVHEEGGHGFAKGQAGQIILKTSVDRWVAIEKAHGL